MMTRQLLLQQTDIVVHQYLAVLLRMDSHIMDSQNMDLDYLFPPLLPRPMGVSHLDHLLGALGKGFAGLPCNPLLHHVIISYVIGHMNLFVSLELGSLMIHLPGLINS